MTEAVDLFVIGGGINGTGIARDAAGRGLSVVLCEKDDLAQGTSSRSGKLVHGGLRYLEYYEFRLVREALIEREVLLNTASDAPAKVKYLVRWRSRNAAVSTWPWAMVICSVMGRRKTLVATTEK